MSESSVLAGTPGSISGFVPFHNAAASAVTITEVTVDEADSATSLTFAVDQTVVGPDQRVRIELRMRLPPQTPPGEYNVELTVAGIKSAAVIHVVEDHTIGLAPDVLVIDNLADETQPRILVVANEGNVDVQLAHFSALPVFADSEARTTLARMATTGLLDTNTEIEPLPTQLGTIEVRPPSPNPPIAAGATTALALQIQVPKGLPQDTRLLAGLPIGLRTVLIAILPHREPKEKS